MLIAQVKQKEVASMAAEAATHKQAAAAKQSELDTALRQLQERSDELVAMEMTMQEMYEDEEEEEDYEIEEVS